MDGKFVSDEMKDEEWVGAVEEDRARVMFGKGDVW